MESVLVIGRVRCERRDEFDELLGRRDLDARVFRQGETLALLLEGRSAEARFLRLLGQPESALALLVACLEDVPLVPDELHATAA